jgi:hypothetical protein
MILLPRRWVLPIRGMRPHWLRKKKKKKKGNKRTACEHSSEVKGKEKQ